MIIQSLRSRGSMFVMGVAFVASSVETQTSPVVWSGTMQTVGSAQQVRYEVSATPASTFLILPLGSGRGNGVTASDIKFSGVSILFKAAFGAGASCKLDAVPARGYRGTCTLQNGEAREMTLVPPIAGMLLPGHEIFLARDAAPAHLASDASVYVLGPTGLSEAVRGSNGFTCYVRRPTVNDFWSTCANKEAAKLLSVDQLRARLRIAGLDERQISDSIASGFRAGRLGVPSVGGIGYMLSTFAWTMNTTTGNQIFLGPHLHFATPNATSESIGADTSEKSGVPMRVEYGGTPESSVIVPVRLRGHG